MLKSTGKRIEILITDISYDFLKIDKFLKKKFDGDSVKIIRDILVEKRFYIVNFGIKAGSLFDGVKRIFGKEGINVAGIEIFKYLEKCKISEKNSDLELKIRLKNINISEIINVYVLPKIKDNAIVYELIKISNDSLDNEIKINLLKLILDTLNEKRVIPQYIDRISDHIEDLSELNIKFDEIKMKVIN